MSAVGEGQRMEYKEKRWRRSKLLRGPAVELRKPESRGQEDQVLLSSGALGDG